MEINLDAKTFWTGIVEPWVGEIVLGSRASETLAAVIIQPDLILALTFYNRIFITVSMEKAWTNKIILPG